MNYLSFFLLPFLLLGCGKKTNEDSFWQDNGKIKVLSSIGMIHDIVERVGGDDIDGATLIQGDFDPHSYELVKGDQEKIERADWIFSCGLGLEHGLSLKRNLENNPKVTPLGDEILKKGASILVSDGTYDPHIWMDISLWAEIIDPVVEVLSQLAPEHEASFKSRALLVRKELLEADQACFAKLQAIEEKKRYLVTCHSAFDYFARRYLATEEERRCGTWRMRAKAPEGMAPDAQLAFADLEKILAHVKAQGINVLFPESNVNRDSLCKIASIAKEMGLAVRIADQGLYADAMVKKREGKSAYLAMIESNVETLVRELAR